jgi:hypothetical protein
MRMLWQSCIRNRLAPCLQAAEGGDVELELWQLMVFLLQQFSKMRDEPIWWVACVAPGTLAGSVCL